jgi:hypothetical protein
VIRAVLLIEVLNGPRPSVLDPVNTNLKVEFVDGFNTGEEGSPKEREADGTQPALEAIVPRGHEIQDEKPSKE